MIIITHIPAPIIIYINIFVLIDAFDGELFDVNNVGFVEFGLLHKNNE